MKSPSQYGSNRNEETSFIRRVAAPDRPNANRRQKKRLAMAGAAATLIGASAGVGYATLRATQTSAVAMPAEQQMAASLEVPDFVEAMGDPYYPSFDELDKDGDGVVSYTEYMKDLNEIWSDNREKIAESALPEVVKEDLNSQLDDKIESDTACVKKAMITSKKRQLTFDRSTINSLYYMLEVFCFDTPIEVPQKYMEMFPDTPVAPPTPVVPDVVAPSATEAATSAPIVIPTTGGGQQTVTLVGPPQDGQQKVEIETGGGVVITTVTVQNTAKGDEKIDIPSPGGDTTTVIVPQEKVPDSNNGGGDTLAPQTDTQAPQSGTGTFTGTNQTPQSGMGDQYNTQAPQQQWPSQNSGGGGSQLQGQQTIDVNTPQGPATVTTDGPVIDGKQDVTITTSDGSTTHATADVIQTSASTNTLVISTGSGGETTTVTVTVPQTNPQSGMGDQYNTQAPQQQWPSQNSGGGGSQQQGQQTIDVNTPQGPATVTTDGPVIDGKQDVTITTSDGSTTHTTADVIPTSGSTNTLVISMGSGGDTTTVTVPQTNTQTSTGDFTGPQYNQYNTQAPQSGTGTYTGDNQAGTGTFTGNNQGTQSGMGDQYNTQAPQQQWPSQNGGGGGSQQQGQQTIDVSTPQGPATVTTDGPVIDGKQDVTITTSDGSTTHTTVDVIPTSGSTNALVIPTGPGGETTTVTVPQTNPQSGTGDQYNTQAPQPQTGDNFDHEDNFHFDVPQVLIETVNGPVTVLFDGPIIDNRQMVTIINVDDSSTTLSLPVTANSDGKNEVEVPTGPGDATTMVEVPEWPAVDSLPKIRHVKPKQQQIAVDTPNGPVTVTTDGPVIDGKQQVTISDNNGDTTTTTVKVTTTTDGNSDLEIPTTNGHTTIVTIPQTSTQAPEVNVITADGPVKVTFDGSIHDGKQDITVTTSDGSKTKETVDVTQTSDGNNQLDISTGSGSQKTTVTVPQTSVQVPAQQGPSENGGGGSQKTIAIDTADGPAVVTFDGPVIDGKQQVTITDNQGNSDTTLVDVTQTSQGTKVDLPTGSGGATTTVTVPSGDNTPTVQQGSSQASSGATGATVNTPQGPVTVTTDGPVIDGKQDVTITTSTGTTTQTTAKVVQTSDSTSTLVISTGPGGQTTTVTVPTDNQTPPSGDTSDILKKLGENDVDNGDKDFMTKDEFQLQIGSHFAEKIMALKEQTRAEDTETDKILKNQKKLEDCILEASEKFGYYGVYEQAPHFDNAVHWIDNDCLNQ